MHQQSVKINLILVQTLRCRTCELQLWILSICFCGGISTVSLGIHSNWMDNCFIASAVDFESHPW